MPIAHATFLVRDLEAAKTFYSAVLAPLKYSVVMEFPGAVGYGTPGGKVDFWLRDTNGVKVPVPSHFAWSAASEEEVQAVHAAALKAGGTCNGPPGLRPQYAPNYYGSFFYDLEGNNMEAVHFKPE